MLLELLAWQGSKVRQFFCRFKFKLVCDVYDFDLCLAGSGSCNYYNIDASDSYMEMKSADGAEVQELCNEICYDSLHECGIGVGSMSESGSESNSEHD